jgi:hypothetical protein
MGNLMTETTSKKRHIGPHSRGGVLAKIDRRRGEAKHMAKVRADLTEHVGGNPSVTQRMLIDRAATLALRLHLMDRQALAEPEFSERNSRQVLAWENTLRLTLAALGMDGQKPKPRTWAEIQAERARGGK